MVAGTSIEVEPAAHLAGSTFIPNPIPVKIDAVVSAQGGGVDGA
jgi:hypothetical protein